MQLTAEEKEHIASFDRKMDQVRDNVGNVISGHRTGFFLTDEGGAGKSFAVLEYLKKEKATYHHHQGRLTARKLFDLLRKFPDDIHLIEDAESMFGEKLWTGIMRNALWSQDRSLHSLRVITWGVHQHNDDHDTDRFAFRGGIIIISNIRMANTKADMQAVLSRVPEVFINLTPAEMAAKQKEICLKGFAIPGDKRPLSPQECLEVRDYIETIRAELKRAIDFRTVINAFYEFHSDKTKDNLTTWQERVVVCYKHACWSLHEPLTRFIQPTTRVGRRGLSGYGLPDFELAREG